MDQDFSEIEQHFETPSTFKNVCFSSLEIWEKQIDNVSEQIKDAINDMSSTFSVLTSDLDEGLDNAYRSTEEVRLDNQVGSTKISDIFEQDKEALEAIITTLSETQNSKRQLIEKFKDFKQFTQKLESMSEQVANNSRMTNILSLNARVEAARSDRSGQGFAVVAQEVRDLSISSAEIGKGISELVANFSKAMTSVIDLAEENAEHDEKVLSSSQKSINDVMTRFKGITSSMAESNVDLHRTGTKIHNEISDVLISLQFQDRVTQILEHISEHMAGLRNHAEENNDDLESWLEIMRSTYTTEEQKLVHDGNDDYSPQPTQPSVTFF